MKPTNLAKHRARARSKEGGAIIFIVAMTLAVLATLGVYALQSAFEEMRASGYARRQTLAQYMSEYGVARLPLELENGNASSFLREGKGGTDACIGNIHIPSPPPGQVFCVRKLLSDVVKDESGNASSISPAFTGSLALSATFEVEISNPTPAKSLSGNSGASGTTTQYEVTSYGIVRPVLPTSTVEINNAGTSMVKTRSFVTASNN